METAPGFGPIRAARLVPIVASPLPSEATVLELLRARDRDSLELLNGGTKPKLAKLSLARMIAATLVRMWKDEEEYDPGRAGIGPRASRARGDPCPLQLAAPLCDPAL